MISFRLTSLVGVLALLVLASADPTNTTDDPDATNDQDASAGQDASAASTEEGSTATSGQSETVGEEKVAADPVKEVLRVLRALSARVDVRERKEQLLYEAFGDYCYHGLTALDKSLKESQVEIPHLHLAITELERKKQAVVQERKAHENDEAACKSAILSAQGIRQDEMKAYMKELALLEGNKQHLESLLASGEVLTSDGASTAEAPPTTTTTGTSVKEDEETASKSAEETAASSFMQADWSQLQKLTFSASSTSQLMDLLQQSNSDTPGAKIQVFEMLKNMRDGVTRDIQSIKKDEAHHEAVFNELEKAKTVELQSLQRSLQARKEREAMFSQQLVTMKSELQDTSSVVDESDKFLKRLKTWCGIRKQSHFDLTKVVAEEKKIIELAIKKMYSDNEVKVFKPEDGSDTLVTFMQMVQRHDHARAVSSEALKTQRSLRGRKSGGDLDTILKMVDKMIEVLQKKLEDDDLKVAVCKEEEQSTKETKDMLSDTKTMKDADIASLGDQLDTLAKDVSTEQKTIQRLDWVVEQATKNREKDHTALVTTISQGAAGVSVLYKARNALEAYIKQGGTFGSEQSSNSDEEFGFLTESVSTQPDPKVYLASIDEVIRAIKDEVAQAKNRDAAAQQEYEGMMQVAQSSRRKNAYSLTHFVGGKAQMYSESVKIQERQQAVQELLTLTTELQNSLSEECAKRMADHDKKEAIQREIDALNSRKEALQQSLAGYDLGSR